jgi:hypothetical protein
VGIHNDTKVGGLRRAHPRQRLQRLQRRLGRRPRRRAPPAQHASPLAGRPYELRHAGVSLALNAAVPATEVARRAGHSVAVLLKIYAHCIDGQAAAANKRIAGALGGEDEDDERG